MHDPSVRRSIADVTVRTRRGGLFFPRREREVGADWRGPTDAREARRRSAHAGACSRALTLALDQICVVDLMAGRTDPVRELGF
jgi:hypothetical protein